MRKLKAPRLTVKAKTGLVLLFIILLTSVLAPVLAPYDPLVSNLSEALQKPSAAHLLATRLKVLATMTVCAKHAYA